MRGLGGVRVSAEVVNCVAVGDWMGDPDVTLGWGRGALSDDEANVVKAGLRWLGLEEIEPGELGVGVVRVPNPIARLRALGELLHRSKPDKHSSERKVKCQQ